MAIHTLTDATIFYDGYDLGGHSNQLELQAEAETRDKTTFGSNGWREHVAGLKTVAFSAQGYNSYGTADPDSALWDGLGGAGIITVTPTGTDGETGYLFKARQSSYGQQARVGEIAAFQLAAAGRDAAGLIKGTILLPKGAKTATGNGTGRQLGAVDSGEKLYASLHVMEVSGTSPTLDVTIVSDDNSGFTSAATRVTFTQATAIGAQWQTVDGAVADDWWRVAFTIGGTDPSFTFAVVAGIA